jgi:hypothetical protein
MDDLLEPDEQVLTFDITDELLERAANPDRTGFTLFYCTKGRRGMAKPPSTTAWPVLCEDLAAQRGQEIGTSGQSHRLLSVSEGGSSARAFYLSNSEVLRGRPTAILHDLKLDALTLVERT